MFKKKEVAQNPYDTEYRHLWELIRRSRDRLCAAVSECLVKNAAVEIYPEGQYREEAIASAKAAKEVIVDRIIQYEQAVTDATEYWNENSDKLDMCKSWNPNSWVCGTKMAEIEISKVKL